MATRTRKSVARKSVRKSASKATKKPVAFKTGAATRRGVRNVANFFRNISAGWKSA